jgi:hypothetical protein
VLDAPGPQQPRSWTGEDLIAFETGANPNNLAIVSPSNGEARLYFEAEADVDDIAVSPDGRWAAYQSREQGTEAVYVRSFPEPSGPIRVSQGEGQFPRCAPDGRTLYYWAAENAPVDTLYAARVTTSPAFSVVSREPVLWGSYVPENWDLHPEGDRIVVAAGGSAAVEGTLQQGGRYFVVLNWFEELGRRLGVRP